MSVHIGVLYHWSPKENREAIASSGLMIGRRSRLVEEGFCPAYICLATSPSSGWGLIIEPEDGPWDLWQVQIRESDHIHIRGDFSPYIREVRVYNGLPADRVWLVGTREA